MKISKQVAQRYLVTYQFLDKPRSLNSNNGIKTFFERVKSIQYDPLNAVGYNSNLVMQSRVKNFNPTLLYDAIYKEKYLVDGWDKCLCIYKRSDWPYFSLVREGLTTYKNRFDSIEFNKYIHLIKEEITKRGPLSSLDFNDKAVLDWSWGSSKISRAVLEHLFYRGEIVVSNKVGTRKYYDLVENEISNNFLVNNSFNNDNDYTEWRLLRRIKSIGMLWNKSGDGYIGIKGINNKDRADAYKRLLNKGLIKEIEVEGSSYKFYVPTHTLGILLDVMNTYPKNKKVSFIAPLDNIIWDRSMIKFIFDFDYKWEVYTPKSKRKYGYYVLPILYGHSFIGRFEPVFDKKSKDLTLKGWWWEKGVKSSKRLYNEVERALNDFSNYLGAAQIKGKDLVKI